MAIDIKINVDSTAVAAALRSPAGERAVREAARPQQVNHSVYPTGCAPCGVNVTCWRCRSVVTIESGLRRRVDGAWQDACRSCGHIEDGPAAPERAFNQTIGRDAPGAWTWCPACAASRCSWDTAASIWFCARCTCSWRDEHDAHGRLKTSALVHEHLSACPECNTNMQGRTWFQRGTESGAIVRSCGDCHRAAFPVGSRAADAGALASPARSKAFDRTLAAMRAELAAAQARLALELATSGSRIDVDALRPEFGLPSQNRRCFGCGADIPVGAGWASFRLVDGRHEPVVWCREEPCSRPAPDPLDAVIDGATLRVLIARAEMNAREEWPICVDGKRRPMPLTSAQRAAVALHHTTQLRAKVAASKAADAERSVSVLVDLEDE